MSLQRASIQFTPGLGFWIPLTGGGANSIPIRPPAIVNAVELQALGVDQSSFTVNIPAIAAGQFADVAYTYTPAGLPVNFSLVAGASGVIMADLIFPTLPTACGWIGYSKSLVFAIGPPVIPGSATWTLTQRQTYQAPSIQGSIRFFSPAGSAAQSLTVAGWAMLLCKPPIVTS